MTVGDMGFRDRVFVYQREKATRTSSSNTNDSIVTFPKQSLYLNHLATLRDSLLAEHLIRLNKDSQRFRIDLPDADDQMEKIRTRHRNRLVKLSRHSPVFLDKFHCDKFKHPSQLPPLTALVEGRNINGEQFPIRRVCPKKKNRVEQIKIQEKVKVNISRLPSQMKPTVSSTGHKAFKPEPLSVSSQSTSQNITVKAKQQKTLATKCRLRPLMVCTPRDAGIEQIKFQPVTDGDRMDIDKMFEEYMSLYREENLTYSHKISITRKRNTSVSNKIVPRSINKKQSTPSTLPKILYKSDSTLSHRRQPVHKKRYSKGSYLTFQTNNEPTSSKKQIVIEMPDIVLNSPSPVPDNSRENTTIGALSKTLKQSELRQKEIRNLLEDVRELNERSNNTHTEKSTSE